MYRNDTYDSLVIKMLQNDLKDNLWHILSNRYTALYFKVNTVIIILTVYCSVISLKNKKSGRY